MSTILDALRKVQRDRERSGRDLHGAIAGEESAPRPRGSAGRLALTALLVVLALGASAYLFLMPDGSDAVGPLTATTAEEVAPASGTLPVPTDVVPPLPQPPTAAGEVADTEMTPERRARVAKALRERRQREMAQASRDGDANTVIAQARAARVQASRRPLPRRAPGVPAPPPQVLEEAAPPVERDMSFELARAQAVPPKLPEPKVEESPAPVPPAPAPRKAVAKPKPRPEAKPKPKPRPEGVERTREAPVRLAETQEPSERLVEARARAPREDATELLTPSFPDLRLETVRWHPDATRREARLLIDSSRTVDAHEGDLVIGVAIERIDPGAVELKLGDRRKRITIGR